MRSENWHKDIMERACYFAFSMPSCLRL